MPSCVKARTSELERLARRKARFQALRDRLNNLFSEDDRRKRGTALESVLNDLFATEGILIRESFTLRSEEGHPVEQIDGALEVDGSAYLVEIKWWGESVEINAMSRHLVRVYRRSEVRALFISASGFTWPAVEESERAQRPARQSFAPVPATSAAPPRSISPETTAEADGLPTDATPAPFDHLR